MNEIEQTLLVLLTSVTLMFPIHAYAEDSFVPCRRFGRLQDCIAVPLAEKAEDTKAKQFQAPVAAKSRIYIVRPYLQEQKKKSSLLIDGQAITEIAPMTYVVLDVNPGVHRITLNTHDNTELQLDLEAGKVYYIQYKLTVWFETVTGHLTLLDEKKGKSQVLESKRVRSTNEILAK